MAKLDQIQASRKQWIETLQNSLSSLDSRLDELTARVREAEPLRDQYEDVIDAARSVREMLTRTADEVRGAADDAWMVFARQGERTLERLRQELGVTEAEVAADLAEARPTLVALAAGLVKTWQARIESLRVQFELGRAEVGDAADEAWSRVEKRFATLQRKVDSFRDDTTHTVDEMRASLRSASHDLRSAFDDLVARVVSRDSA